MDDFMFVFKCSQCDVKKPMKDFDMRETANPPIPFKTCRACCKSKRDAYYRKKQRDAEKLVSA